MKKVTKVVVCLCAVGLVCMLSACSAVESAIGSDSAKQKAVIENYYQAVNDADLDAMLECCDTNTQNTMESTIAALQGLLNLGGVDSIDVKQIVAGLYPSIKSSMKNGNMTYNIEPSSIEISEVDKTHANATVMEEISVTVNSTTQTSSSRSEMALVCEGGDWRIDLSEQMQDAFGSAWGIATSLF